ncbi:MAG: hypothetical protein ACRCXQ_01490 [Vagococcus fluvialis]
MMILSEISWFVGEVVGLVDLIAGSIVQFIFWLFKIWFRYLSTTISTGGALSIFAWGLMIGTIFVFVGALFYLFKYLGIWLLIVVPILTFFLKLFIMIFIFGLMFVMISNVVRSIRNKFNRKEDNHYA